MRDFGLSLGALSREVRALTEGLTSLKPEPKKRLSFKEKRSIEKTKAVPWERRSFRNRARDDHLAFQHWVKSSETHTDSAFARLNKKLEIFEYSDLEYAELLSSDKW